MPAILARAVPVIVGIAPALLALAVPTIVEIVPVLITVAVPAHAARAAVRVIVVRALVVQGSVAIQKANIGSCVALSHATSHSTRP